MEETKPTDRVIEIVKPHLTEKGFQYKKSGRRFTKKFPLGRQCFSLSFDGRGGLTTVNCGFFIYFDQLIDLYGKILSVKTGDWSFQIKENSLKRAYYKLEKDTGFLFDDKFGGMSLSEKSKFSSHDVHPEYRIRKGADFIIEAFELYAETHFNKINNYERLFDALIHAVRAMNKNNQCSTPFINLNLQYDEEQLIYYSLVLALCLDKDTEEITALADDVIKRYIDSEKVKQNIQKIYDYNKDENLKIALN